jgi:hypothetical protein
MRRPAKLTNVMGATASATKTGSLLYSSHANERMWEREIVKPEVEAVLVHGHHEARKDQFNERHHAWDYAIRGKTVDGRSLRIVVAILGRGLLVVTAIDLDKED